MLKNNTTIILFAPLFILSVLFYLPNSGGFGYALPFNSLALASLALVVFALINCACRKQEFAVDGFFKAACLLLVMLLIPLLWSNEFQLYKSLPRFFTILLGILFYFALSQLNPNETQLKQLLLLICFSTCISSCFALYQNYLMTSDSYFAIKIEYGRPTGIFQQVNLLASYTATGFAISLYLIRSIKNKLIINLLLFSLLINLWVLFLTQSRTGLLAGALIALFYIFLFIKNKQFKKSILFVTLIGMALILAKNLPYSLDNDYITKKEVISSPKIRLNIYQDSFELFLQKPFLGHGYGSYHNALINYAATKSEERNNTNYAAKVTHPHNEIVLWVVEGGIFAGIPMVLFFSYFCHLILSGKAINKIGLFLLITPILIHILTEHPFYQSTIHYSVFITLLFIVLKFCNSGIDSVKLPTSAIKILNLVTFIILIAFSLTALQSSIVLRKYIYKEPNNHMLLSQAFNPFIEYKFREIRINTLKLEAALQQKNYDGVIDFIEWSERFLQAYSSDYVYFETIRALKSVSMNTQANTLTIHAKYLYPQNNSWDTGIWKPSNS